MPNMKELLKKLGLTEDEINEATAEKPSDNFKIDEVVNRVREHTIQVHEAANPRPKDEDIQGKIIAAQKDIKYKIAQSLGISETRGNIEKMNTEDFNKLVTAKKEELAANSAGDQQLKAQLNELTQKLIGVNQELENERESKARELETIKLESAKSVKEFKRDAIIERYANSIDWGVPDVAKQALIKDFTNKVAQQDWTINDDGTLSGSDGKGLAIDFDKKGSFKTIKEAMEREFEPVTKKSTGSGGEPPARVVAGVDTSKITSDANKETMAFLES